MSAVKLVPETDVVRELEEIPKQVEKPESEVGLAATAVVMTLF
jgi:hypothetical protein